MSPEAVSHLSNVWFKVTDLQVASGRGCRVTTTDGEEYLDFAAGIAVNSTGHSHPHVVEAIADAGRPVRPRPGQRVHPRPARAAGRPPGRRDARRHRHVLLRQLGGRDHRGGDQAGQAGHRTPERDRVRRLVPRPHPPDDGDDDVEDDLPGRPRPAAGGHLRGAVPRPAGPRPGRRGGSGAARAGPPAGHDDRAGGDGGDDPRARARRGRLRPGADGVPGRHRRTLPRPRHPVRRRRGAERVRAHGRDVRRRPPRHPARRDLHGQGHRVGLPVRRPRHATRARRPLADGQPRRDLRRQPDGVRRRPGHARRHHRARLPGRRPGPWRAARRRPARAAGPGRRRPGQSAGSA